MASTKIKKVNKDNNLNEAFTFKSAFNTSFNLFKKYGKWFVGVMIVDYILNISDLKFAGSLRDSANYLIKYPYFAFYFIISSYITTIAMKIALLAKDDKNISNVNSIFISFPLYLKKLISDIILNLLILSGMFLFILPGVIAAIRLQFAGYLILDKNVSIKDAFILSWVNTKGNSWKIFYILLIFLIFNILSVFLIFPAIVITYPLFLLVQIYFYKNLFKN